MSIYLKEKMDALQKTIIKITKYISNSAININTCGIRNKIHRLIDTQNTGNKIKQIVI